MTIMELQEILEMALDHHGNLDVVIWVNGEDYSVSSATMQAYEGEMVLGLEAEE